MEEVYQLVAGEDGIISKEELIDAQGGDYRLFQHMDADNGGSVSKLEWLIFMRGTHAQKSLTSIKKGDKWLDHLMFTLRRGCGMSEMTLAQEREARDVYNIVANLKSKDGLMSKEDLVQAQGGDMPSQIIISSLY